MLTYFFFNLYNVRWDQGQKRSKSEDKLTDSYLYQFMIFSFKNIINSCLWIWKRMEILMKPFPLIGHYLTMHVQNRPLYCNRNWQFFCKTIASYQSSTYNLKMLEKCRNKYMKNNIWKTTNSAIKWDQPTSHDMFTIFILHKYIQTLTLFENCQSKMTTCMIDF